MKVVRQVDAAAEVAVDWRMAVDADTSTSSMGDDDPEEEEREAYEYDSRAFSGVLDKNESSGMESGWENGERIADVGIPGMLAGMDTTQEADSQKKSTFELFVGSQEERIKDVKELSMALGSMDADETVWFQTDRIHQTVYWMYPFQVWRTSRVVRKGSYGCGKE